jgi:translation initiation factor eIF-2B subunit gamma
MILVFNLGLSYLLVIDVLLICPAIHRAALYHHMHSDVTSSSLRVDIESYEETQESPAGTCELLRHFANRITEDFVLVPCDFLAPPTLPLSELLDTFRVESTSNDTLLTSCWFPAHIPDKSILSDEWGPSPNSPPIVWDAKSSTLLHIDTSEDIDKNNEELELSVGMISRCGC